MRMDALIAVVTRSGIGSTVRYTVKAGDVVLSFAANAAGHPSLSIAGHAFRWGFARPSAPDPLAPGRWLKPAEYAESLKPWVENLAHLGGLERATILADEQKHWEKHAASLADSLKVASKSLAAVQDIPR